MIAVSHEIPLPPSPFIRDFAERLPAASLDVLDVGCHKGRNAYHMAQLGHRVIGLDMEVEALVAALPETAGQVSFVAGDLRRLPIRGQFDVILMNEVFQHVTHTEATDAVRQLQHLTRRGGFHAVSGYIGDRPGALKPFELHEMYHRSGWHIVNYDEDRQSCVQFGGKEALTSLAKLIAHNRP